MNNCIVCGGPDSQLRFLKLGWHSPERYGWSSDRWEVKMDYYELPVCWPCFSKFKPCVDYHRKVLTSRKVEPRYCTSVGII